MNKKTSENVKKKPPSAFMAWFRAQHGTRWTHPRFKHVNDQWLRKTAALGELAAGELREREVYDARARSALYAWNVRDNINVVRRTDEHLRTR